MLGIIIRFLFLFFFNNWNGYIIFLVLIVFFFINTRFEYGVFNVYIYSEIDYLSYGLVILSFWLIILSFLARINIKNSNSSNYYSFFLVMIFLFLYLSFVFNNYLLFYISFECCLIPILFMILGWGYQPERLNAGLYLLFYTLLASLPLLVLIIRNFYYRGLSIVLKDFSCCLTGFFNLILILAFLVKFPIYITHLWLPKAHVEAPVAGSMILAGILLKLGGYGIIRFLSLSLVFSHRIQVFIICLSIYGGFIVSINCLSLIDIKSLIACSSVVHISICIRGLLIFNDWGLKGCYLIIIGHGLCSSGLFF